MIRDAFPASGIGSSRRIWHKGSDLASADPLILDGSGNYHDVTGTTGISEIRVPAGTLFMFQFDGALTLTHSATLDLPGEANFTTSAGDRLIGFAEADNSVQVLSITRAKQQPGQHVVQVVNTQDGAVATGTTLAVMDDTIPQNTEGDEYMTLAITPKNTSNTLLIEVVAQISHSTATSRLQVALFQDSTANALAAVEIRQSAASTMHVVSFIHKMTAGTTGATTFKVRAGSNTAGTTTLNGINSTRQYGGVIASSITITEYAA